MQYIPHHEINKQKWNELIETSLHSKLYAHSDFLDAMSPGWDALVSDDYEMVMPLTRRRKYGIKYLCQPAFAQQLGVFSRQGLQEENILPFLEKAKKHFNLIEIFLNDGCRISGADNLHQNYVLDLSLGYEKLRSGYKNDMLKNLARTSKFDLQYIESQNVQNAINLYEEQYGKQIRYRPSDFQNLKVLCEKWMNQQKCLVKEVYLGSPAKGDLLAIGLFLKDKHRLYNIVSTTLPNGRMLEANHFLFDQLIREFAGNHLLLDFEGSDLPGVARFYQKFNPVNQPYNFYRSNRLPVWMRWMK